MIENWLDVVGYEGLYEVSDLGNVRNKRTKRIMKIRIKKDRCSIQLSKPDHQKRFQIHRLVAEAFIPKTEEDILLGRDCIDHIDGNSTNNAVTNLRWCTREENWNFPEQKERSRIIAKHHRTPVKVYCVENDTYYDSIKKASKALGILAVSISSVVNGYRKSTNGMHFKKV